MRHDGAILLHYGLKAGDKVTNFSANEWSSLSADSFKVTSDSNIDFEIELGSQPGELYLIPQAPGGDVYAAHTGEIPFHIQASHVYDEQVYEASFTGKTMIDDDIPWSDRALNWFTSVGWKLLLTLLALILLLGYVFKRRFSKKIKRSPTIRGIPMILLELYRSPWTLSPRKA